MNLWQFALLAGCLWFLLPGHRVKAVGGLFVLVAILGL